MMGKQINLYRNNAIEARIIDACKHLGLKQYNDLNGCWFAYQKPGDNWFESDVIQYSDSLGKDTHQARLWTGSVNPEFIAVFEKLRRFIKSKSRFDRPSSLWIWKDYDHEFVSYYSEKQQNLDTLVRKNIEYARSILGANIISDDEHLER